MGEEKNSHKIFKMSFAQEGVGAMKVKMKVGQKRSWEEADLELIVFRTGGFLQSVF